MDLKIIPVGTFPELERMAAEGNIFPHVVCGVDVYRRKEIAVEDQVQIDPLRA